MFKVKNLLDICPFHRKQVLRELFEKGRHGPVRQAWSCPGHLFLKLGDGATLFTFDVKPSIINEYEGHNKTLDLSSTPSPILDILFRRKTPNTAYVVFENSCVQTWSYSRESHVWSKDSEFFLSSTDGATVLSVVLHDEQCAVYWCEKDTANEVEISSDVDTYHCYTICSRIFPRDKGLSPDTIGSINVLLTHCLPSTLYTAGDCLLIWLHEPCPPGVYLKWMPTTYSIEVHVYPYGPVLSEKRYGKTLDFKNLLKPITATWAAVQPISGWQLVCHPSNQKVLCITPHGAVLSISAKDCIEEVVTLTDAGDWLSESECFVCYFGLAVVKERAIRIYSLASGQLLQELCPPGNAMVTGHFQSSMALPQAGVITQNSLYQIQLLPHSQWNGKIKEAPCILEKLNKSQHASQLALEEVYNYYKKRSMSGEVPMEVLLRSEVFQTPGLLLALLQESRTSADPLLLHRDLNKQLQEASQSGHIKTKLYDDLGPMLDQFWNLENQKNACVEGKQDPKNTNISQVVLYDEVFRLLQPQCPLVVEARCSQLEVLVCQNPEEVLTAIRGYLQGDDAEGMLERWRSILSVEHHLPISNHDNSSLLIFEALCRIIFKHQPDQLMDFVHAAKKVYDLTVSGSAFVRSGEKVQLYHQALRCIPKPEQTVHVKDAAMATAKLLMESQIPDCESRSIQVLLKWHLWPEAIQHVRQMEHTPLRSQLFNSLVEAAIRENVLAEYCSSILDMCPPELSCLDILNFLRRQHGDGSIAARHGGEEDSIFCSEETRDLPVMSLRPHLIGRIKHS